MISKGTNRILLSLILLSTGLYGQEKAERNYAFESQVFNGKANAIERPIPYEDIKGSPFHNDSLKLGILLFNAGDTLHHYMRYNAYTDEIEFVNKNTIQALAEPHLLNKIYLNNQVYLYREFLRNNRNEKGYYLLVLDKKCKLYKRDMIEFEEYEPAKNDYDTEKPARFTPFSTEYYCSCGTTPPALISNKSVDIKQVFGESYEVARKFIKKSKLKMKKEVDIILLLNYMDGLE